MSQHMASKGSQTQYPRNQSIPQVFEEIVRKYGKRTAVSSVDGTMTYESLNRQANRVARGLQKLGVKKGRFVGISMERGCDLIVNLLAILKAGGVYVPIDPSYPEPRKRFMKEDAGLKIILTEALEDLASNDSNLKVKVGPLDLAYIHYTSGSTGTPKGVEIYHRGVIRLVKGTDWIEISCNDRFSQISNSSFDASTFEIWGALLNGATLCLYPPGNLSAEGLGAFLIREKITILDIPARLFALMVDHQLDSLKQLRYICPGGDVLSAHHAKIAFKALPKCKIINTYGPTENTTNTTAYLIKDLKAIEREVPIGRPISNTTVYLLDQDLHQVPMGTPGELCAGGDGLARGYLHRDDLTREKWIKNPFGKGKLYRTGDLALLLPSGDLSFLGRMDRQVKIRGFRVELEEIEETLRRYRDVEDCVVVFREEKIIVYVVWKKKGILESLREFLEKILPAYMVPSFFVELKKIPLDANGKVDRKGLPLPQIKGQEKISFHSERERAIAKVWAKVLGVKQVAPQDHFFKLGGDSILAMEMISLLKKEWQIEISIDQLFHFPILADFAEQKATIVRNIPKRKRKGPLPLSFNQESLWLVNQSMPYSQNYVLHFAFRLKGNIDIPRLEQSIEEMVERHEILRTRFTEDGMQVVENKGKILFHYNENRPLSFLLQQLPLFQVTLRKISGNEYVCEFHFHHIIFDGWSADLFFQELSALYARKKIAPLPLQYGDYALWQRENLDSKQLDYWKKQLAGVSDLLEMPWDKPRPTQFSGRGDVQTVRLSKSLSEALQELARQQGVTAFVLLVAAFKVLLHRYSGQDDLVIGTPFANRNGYPLQSLIGFFVQMLVIRSSCSDDPSFETFLAQTAKTVADAVAHGDIPFEKLVSELNPTRSSSYNPLFQVSFSLEKPTEGLSLERVKVKPIDSSSKTAKFDLALTIVQGDRFQCVMEYCTDLFEKQTIVRMLGHFQTLLEAIVKHPKQKIKELPLLTQQEKQVMLVQWNQTKTPYPKEQSICSLFEEMVEQSKDRTALRFEGKTMSYSELNRRSNQLARHLKKWGIEKQEFVGVYLERSFDLNIAILAILKAGGVYVPIDASYPKERKLFMVKDASLRLIVTHSRFAKMFQIDLLCLDQEDFKKYEDTNLELKIDPLDLAYIDYTSGSTGTPKGVQVTHRGVIRLVRNIHWNDISKADRFLQISNISFDAFTHEMWGALLNGACICIFPQTKWSTAEIGRFLVREKVTQVLFTARLFNLMVDEQIESLKGVRYLCSCGEAMSPQHAKKAFESLPRTRVKNTCGHTENTTHTTTYDITDLASIEHGVPIGRPISNTTIYILDPYGQPVPIGVHGELYTGGDGVARGYLNQEALTEEKFVPNPFGEGKLYRTGDLVRYLPDGNVAYIGRLDNQVKIRGFRVELGEIEEVLQEWSRVAGSAVILNGDRLIAYVEPSAGQKISVEEIHDYLSSRLPQFMVPNFIVILKKFPVTPNGKVDRKALPEPKISTKKKIFFQTKTEKEVASIWSQILSIEKIAPTDHFFKLGGDSIQAMRLISSIKKSYQIDASIHSVFRTPILSDFARWIDSQKKVAVKQSIAKRKIRSPIPLSFNQESLWLLEKFNPKPTLYMIPFAFRIQGKALKASFENILARHEILRTRFVEKNGKVLQRIEKRCPGAFVELKMTEKEGLEFIRQKAQEGMDLSQLPLLQLHLIQVRPHHYLGLLRAHHIIFDGWSIGVFFRELLSKKSPDLPIQYGDFAVWQRSFLATPEAKKQLDYWERQLRGAPDLLELPWDFPRVTPFSGKGAKESFELSEILVQSLSKLAKEEGVTLFALTLAAFKVLLSRYSRKEDLLVGTPFANRTKPELESLIGFFVQMLVIRTQIKGSFIEFVHQVSETLSEGYRNGDIPFAKIVEVLNPPRSASYNPIFQVGFGSEPTELNEIPLELNVAKFDLNLSMNGRRLDLEYATDLFAPATIQRMLKNYVTLLQEIVAHPYESAILLPLLSHEEAHQLIVEWNDTKRKYPRDDSIPSLFEKRVKQQPEKIALRFLGDEMCYRELNERANQCAHNLRNEGVKRGDLVGISLDRSFDLIVALLGILKAGAAYVPIDAAYPQERRTFMIRDSGVKTHVTKETLGKGQIKNFSIDVGPLDLAYVNYTSGSTGLPKGVEVTHRGVVRQSKNSGFFECGKGDRVLHMASISFDATTTEIWNALLNGATLCILPKQPFSAEELAKFLREEKITHALFTARIFNVMVDQEVSSLKNLKYLVSGGEAMSAHHAKMAFAALPNTQIVNAYGPTENTVCTTLYEISDPSAFDQTVPIGRPIGNTQVYLLDPNQQPVPIGVPGEIYAGGDGIAKGYLNRPELTAKAFVSNPLGEGILYRTGDLAKYLPDGNLVYLGRLDNQVKIRGIRVELGEIEEVLRQQENVADCIVAFREDLLIGYVEPKSGKKLTEAILREYASTKLPKSMIPSFFLILEKFPITPNGKIDRNALPAPLQALESRVFDPLQTATEELIAATWSILLKIPKVGRTDHFFHLGGNSIAAAQLTSLVSKEFSTEIPISLIFEHPILQTYAEQVERFIAGKHPKMSRRSFMSQRDQEAVLDPSIQPEGSFFFTKPKNVFLTGATGFVGAFFLKELIENTQAKIYCLIRAKNKKEGCARLKATLQKYLIWNPKWKSRVVIVPGNLEKKCLGIESKQFDHLAANIDSIFHFGALVNHALPYESLKSANVYGTQEALRLACKTRTKPFHFISTAAVVATDSEKPIEEDVDLSNSQDLFNGYAESKWVAEKLVLIARSRGLPANIYRFARVSGDSRTGAGPTGDFLWRVVQASIRLQMAPNIDYREDITPVDYLCKALWFISSNPSEMNRQFHLINPRSYSYRDLFKFLKELGYQLSLTNFDNWRKMLTKMAIETNDPELQALMPLFAELDLSQEKPLMLSSAHVAKALRGSQIKCPKIDEMILKKYINYFVKIKFIKKLRAP